MKISKSQLFNNNLDPSNLSSLNFFIDSSDGGGGKSGDTGVKLTFSIFSADSELKGL